VRLHNPKTTAANDEVADVLSGLSPTDHPRLTALREEMLSGTPTTRLIWSLEVLIDGITTRPPQPEKPS
jgi:hypothetical protein